MPTSTVHDMPGTLPGEATITVTGEGPLIDGVRDALDGRLFEPTEDDREANVLYALKRDAADARAKSDKADEKADELREAAFKAETVLADFVTLRGESA